MQYLPKNLETFKARHPFFIGIDSDGCVFDTMELKHKECFIPEFIQSFSLQSYARYARETWEFVNLYSKTRGVNRFKALILTMDILAQRQELEEARSSLPSLSGLKRWVEETSSLGNSSLHAELEKNPHPDLQLAYAWTLAVTERISAMVKGLKPFPAVQDALSVLAERADAMVISQSPCADLQREWEEHDLAQYVHLIAGQEYGSKAQSLGLASMGKYKENHVLMLGDAPGDYQAAKNNGALFFPIIPGKEVESWKEFAENALLRFFNLDFAGSYENERLAEFEASLPSSPPWS